MPLLFKNGKLVVNDIDQLVFSDDPNSCRCCPGLCECPPEADYTEPKYVSDVSFTVSNVPDTYYAELNVDALRRYSDGSVDYYVDSKRFDIYGLSALNGTYPYALESKQSFETPCVQPDPFPACPYDANMDCVWRRRFPVVPVTGAFTTVGRNKGFGTLFEQTWSESFYITGWAMLTPYPAYSVEGSLENEGTAKIELELCFRVGSYSGQVRRVLRITFQNVRGASPGSFIGNVYEVLFLTAIGSQTLRRNCVENDFVYIAPDILETANTFLTNYYSIPNFYSFCRDQPAIYDTINPYWCYDARHGDSSFRLDACTNSKTRTKAVPPPIFGPGLGYTQTSNWDYDLSGFLFDVSYSYTLDPP